WFPKTGIVPQIAPESAMRKPASRRANNRLLASLSTRFRVPVLPSNRTSELPFAATHTSPPSDARPTPSPTSTLATAFVSGSIRASFPPPDGRVQMWPPADTSSNGSRPTGTTVFTRPVEASRRTIEAWATFVRAVATLVSLSPQPSVTLASAATANGDNSIARSHRHESLVLLKPPASNGRRPRPGGASPSRPTRRVHDTTLGSCRTGGRRSPRDRRHRRTTVAA